ncbi:Uncharacterized protein HZ326_25363 [Fusarium oxysporum f. sp. albedinis]|nr:Uncharacterized protein HZ326_25363 [Fusarium oxysporum f. sp. albedinis]
MHRQQMKPVDTLRTAAHDFFKSVQKVVTNGRTISRNFLPRGPEHQRQIQHCQTEAANTAMSLCYYVSILG